MSADDMKITDQDLIDAVEDDEDEKVVDYMLAMEDERSATAMQEVCDDLVIEYAFRRDLENITLN